jgi:hypothetical protein
MQVATEAERNKEVGLPAPAGGSSPPHPCCTVSLVVWPPELKENKAVWFEATQPVAILLQGMNTQHLG